MSREIGELNKAVFKGNGKDSIVVMITQTRDSQINQGRNVDILNQNVAELLKFQNRAEASEEIKKMVKLSKRWAMGLAIGAIISITCALIIVIAT